MASNAPLGAGWRPFLAAGMAILLGLFSVSVAASQDIGPAVAVAQDASLGSILTNPEGWTLYAWTRDDPGVSNYVGNNWLRLVTSGLPIGPAGLVGNLGATALSDGTLQVTYNGWPLYTYVNDTGPGTTVGQGAGGGTWWTVNPAAVDVAELVAIPARTTLWRENTSLGSILVDQNGWTLYTFTRDEPGVSNCTGGCAQTWLPLLATSAPVAPAGFVGTLGTITREDGAMQVTYNGWPAYRFARDSAAGDTAGQGVGGSWFVVNPSGDDVMLTEAPPTEAPAPTGVSSVGVAQHPDRGLVLTDGRGMTLYVLAEDREADNVSTCYADNDCTIYWPVVSVEGAPIGAPGVTGQLGTQARRDAVVQLTYNGRPLYYFIADREPGQFLGDRVVDQWGRWFAVSIG